LLYTVAVAFTVYAMRNIGVIWAILGVSALLVRAILPLSARALEALEMELSTMQWIILIVFALFMMMAEGYRGFQKKFSPRTAARIRYLRQNPTGLRVALAPFFAMGFFDANRKTRLTAWILTLGIIALVILVSLCPQPWRGIIDFGVVLGLSWGLVSFWIYTGKALTSEEYDHSPQMP